MIVTDPYFVLVIIAETAAENYYRLVSPGRSRRPFLTDLTLCANALVPPLFPSFQFFECRKNNYGLFGRLKTGKPGLNRRHLLVATKCENLNFNRGKRKNN